MKIGKSQDPFIESLDEINSIITKQNEALIKEDYTEIQKLYREMTIVLERILDTPLNDKVTNEKISEIKRMTNEIETNHKANEQLLTEKMDVIKKRMTLLKNESKIAKNYKNILSKSQKGLIDIKK
jgi:hypothetical protein